MPTTYDALIERINAYQARTGISDAALSKAMGLTSNYIFYLRKGRRRDVLDKMDLIVAFCGND